MKRNRREELDCRQVLLALQTFLDTELDAARAELVALHLATCRNCDLESAALQRVIDAIRALREEYDSVAHRRLADTAERLAMAHGPRDEDRQQRW